MSNVYANIKAIRTAKNLKQEEVAQKIGMAQSNYARLEKGLTQATVERLQQLADIFDMSVAAILSYESGQEPTKEDIRYYVDLCRKYEKQIEQLKQRVTELEEEGVEDRVILRDEIKVLKDKNKALTERLKDKDKTVQLLEKAIDSISKLHNSK